MSNSDFRSNEDELDSEERALGERIATATRYRLPPALATRLEQEIAAGLPAPPKSNFERLRPLALVAALVVLVVAGALFLLLNDTGAASAAEISKRVSEASLRNVQNGSIVHRVYSVKSNFQSVVVTGTHEEWAQVDTTGNVTHYKVVQDEFYNGQPNRTLLLYLKEAKVNQAWSQFTNTIYNQKTEKYEPKLNPLEDISNLIGTTSSSAQGTAQITSSRVETKNDVYIVSFFNEYKDTTGKTTYSRSEFHINKKSYAVTKVVVIMLQSATGPDSPDRYEANLQSTEILPPDSARTQNIFVLGAPPDAKIVNN